MSDKRPVTKPGAPDPLIGRTISDRYKITSLIARGGMGKVYRAEQAPLGRLCAIKVLNPNYTGDADPEFHKRFFREAAVTAKITHPNCVTIFDYGKTDDGILYMVMEYLDGKTLHQALRDGGVMHEMRAGRIASQICRALREAHNLGVIHRDLKPANIFLTRPSSRAPDVHGTIPPPSEEDEDFVKVLDFGLVKHLNERPEEHLTQTGLFMGSPKYMAPEQIQGGHVDARTDIYSLGIIMYEMLAGKVPFERATSVNILMAHVAEPPPPMREVNPNLLCSPAFEDLVMRCIAKEPNDRLSTMDEVLQALRRAHGGSMVSMANQLAAPAHGPHGTGPYAQGSGPYAPGSGPYPQGSGAYSVHGTGPPPPLAGWAPVSTPPPTFVQPAPMRPIYRSTPPGVTGSHTGMAVIRSEHAADYSGAIETKPRSKIWVLFGVLVAAGIGGGLGMLAFHWTAPKDPVPVTPPPSAVPSASAAASASAAPSASASAAPPGSVLHVVTDPTGASVKENGKDLCGPTPCDVTFKADETTKVHSLSIEKKGFKAETRSFKPTEGPKSLDVKLTKTKPKPDPDK